MKYPVHLAQPKNSAASIAVGSTVAVRATSGGAKPDPEIVYMGSPLRPLTDFEGWNVGLISPSQPGLTEENHRRNLGSLA